MFDVAAGRVLFRLHGFRTEESSRWYVVRTQFAREVQVFQRPRQIGLCAWLPEFQAKPDGPIRALLDRYLLMQANLGTEQWQRVYREPGVDTILGPKGGRPTPLPPGALDELLGQVGINGVICAKTSTPASRIASGAAIRVTGGQFAGWLGVCRWSSGKRVAVLLSILGRDVQAQMPHADIVAA